MMAHPSEHMRHASITEKVEAVVVKKGREKILRDLEAQIKSMEKDL